jgi:hypothetical protein
LTVLQKKPSGQTELSSPPHWPQGAATLAADAHDNSVEAASAAKAQDFMMWGRGEY